MLKKYHRLFDLGHLVISVLFFASAVVLILFASVWFWRGISPLEGVPLEERVNHVLEGIAVLTVAIAALELGQTILEEEVQREATLSAPTRVRRFLSRFMIVLVVALSIEALVAVFQFTRNAPPHLLYAAAVGIMAAALLAAWGLFTRLNLKAEKMEPHALEDAREEDENV